MAIFFVDSLGHYTTVAQCLRKVASTSNAPVAATGAFGMPGIKPGANGYMVNYAATATVELSAYIYLVTSASSGDADWIFFRNAAGNQVAFYLRNDGSINVTDGVSAALGASAANVVSFGVHHHIYVKIFCSKTVGTVTIKIDGTQVLALTGKNTSPQTAVEATQAALYGDTNSPTANCVWSHIAMANVSGDITGQPRVEAVFADGAGATTNWTTLVGAATHYQAINETTPDDDTSYIASSTVGQVDTYTYSNLLTTANTILCVAVVPMVRKDDATSREIAPVVRTTDAVDYLGATRSVPGSYGYLQAIWATNPFTGVAWTPAEVNAIEAGIKVIT